MPRPPFRLLPPAPILTQLPPLAYQVRLVTVPQFDPAIFGGGCDPYLCVNMMVQDEEKRSRAEAEGKGGHVGCTCYKTVKVYNQKSVQSKVQKCHPGEKYADLDVGDDEALCVRGNVQVRCRIRAFLSQLDPSSRPLNFPSSRLDGRCRHRRRRRRRRRRSRRSHRSRRRCRHPLHDYPPLVVPCRSR